MTSSYDPPDPPRAACKDADLDPFDPDESVVIAANHCPTCHARKVCLSMATNHEGSGCWGGLWHFQNHHEQYIAVELVACRMCGAPFWPIRATKIYCSIQCGVRASTVKRQKARNAARWGVCTGCGAPWPDARSNAKGSKCAACRFYEEGAS